MGTRSDLRAALDDLTGPLVRWLLVGLVVADLMLLVAIVVVDQRIEPGTLRTVGVGVPVVGGLALSMMGALGDGLRAARLRLQDGPVASEERLAQRRQLALRSMLLTLVWVVLLLVGPQVIILASG
jgi:hypothetical protein